MSDYKPTEHDGLRQDGQPDQRVGTGEFAHGKVDPHEAGKKGGHSSGVGASGNNNDDYDDDSNDSYNSRGGSGGDYKPTEHGGKTKDGKPDGRVKGNN